ncbi:random slug protein [Gracilaria domingensis]|nr:random slug protein [Gracilaria domingensis]
MRSSSLSREEPTDSHGAPATASNEVRPHSPLSRSHLPHVSLPHVPHVSVPHVPSLPSMRKLFHTSSNDSQPAPVPTALAELSAKVEHTFGPVGNLSPKYASMSDDCLIIELCESVHSRRRVLVQFLRARQGNSHDAFVMMLNTFKWREATDMHLYLSQSAINMLRPNSCFPMHIVSDPETCKQPVAYGLPRLLDKRKVDRADFQNALLSFLESMYFAHTYILDEIIIILDFREWSIRRNAPYRLVKEGIQTLQDYYPDRLGYVFLVNYPVTIRAAYTVVSPIIDAGAKEKIVWASEDDPAATLSKYIATKSIPTFLGGELETIFPAIWPDVASEFDSNR